MVSLEGMGVGTGVFALGVGVFGGAYYLARFDEQVDAIGSKRSASEVEPAGWKVGYVAGLGGALMLVGTVIFLLALIS